MIYILEQIICIIDRKVGTYSELGHNIMVLFSLSKIIEHMNEKKTKPKTLKIFY